MAPAPFRSNFGKPAARSVFRRCRSDRADWRHLAGRHVGRDFLLFSGNGLASVIGAIVVAHNVVSSLLESYLFAFVPGWLYVFGVGVLGGMVLRQKIMALRLRRSRYKSRLPEDEAILPRQEFQRLHQHVTGRGQLFGDHLRRNAMLDGGSSWRIDLEVDDGKPSCGT